MTKKRQVSLTLCIMVASIVATVQAQNYNPGDIILVDTLIDVRSGISRVGRKMDFYKANLPTAPQYAQHTRNEQQPLTRQAQSYHPGDIAVINAIIDAHPGLGWTKANPADGSYSRRLGWSRLDIRCND